MKFILYNQQFFNCCVSIFKSNVPVFFSSEEEVLFSNYLLKPSINYYVVLNSSNNLIASGGYEYEKDKDIVSLTWGMVDYKYHNLGYGTSLTEYRLQKIKKEFSHCSVELNTSQKTFKFYQKFGFQIIKITQNYYAPGLDRYDLLKKTSIN